MSARIVLRLEGKTERAFRSTLQFYLQQHLAGRMPKLQCRPFDRLMPVGRKLRELVEKDLDDLDDTGQVIVLTDVYTGNPRRFKDAADAIGQMREWVGANPRVHVHAAQYEFEAWLLPYWSRIQQLAKSDRKPPKARPEDVNHQSPPSSWINLCFLSGEEKKTRYLKGLHAGRILENADLSLAIAQCPQLKALVNTILKICGANLIT